jgi:hypothetical protein
MTIDRRADMLAEEAHPDSGVEAVSDAPGITEPAGPTSWPEPANPCGFESFSDGAGI